MKRFAILAFVAALLSTALSCSKNDDASVLVGEWHYMDYQDIENIEWDDYDLQSSTVFKSHHKGKSWDGDVEHAMGHHDYYYVGTYSFKNGTLTLNAEYEIDGDDGRQKTVSKTLTFKVETSPISASTSTITIYNNQKNRREEWTR